MLTQHILLPQIVILIMHTADCMTLFTAHICQDACHSYTFIHKPYINQIYYILDNTALTLLLFHIGISYNALESCIHYVIWPYYISGQLVCHMIYLYKYVSISLCYMHIHPLVVSLTCIHTLRMHAS